MPPFIDLFPLKTKMVRNTQVNGGNTAGFRLKATALLFERRQKIYLLDAAETRTKASLEEYVGQKRTQRPRSKDMWGRNAHKGLARRIKEVGTRTQDMWDRNEYAGPALRIRENCSSLLFERASRRFPLTSESRTYKTYLLGKPVSSDKAACLGSNNKGHRLLAHYAGAGS